ncbi:DnaJ domain-containing protein [Phanerochaete sordida]|uniref:DnaJ domain-containing protein n=1 Tax=Phanerochaete sordida TaxID=48140 RepID=A0A9P3LHZ7_9APHY|nr:DnaJ domain-containing protein [Phanerochaete sordida]
MSSRLWMQCALPRRLAFLDTCIRPIQRQASTSANPYPYPTTANPTPHQIFHLPRSATKADVKARYYELVRIYHPDSPVSRPLPPATAQARFHAISAAYDALRGKRPLASDPDEPQRARTDYHDLSTAMWRAKQRRRAELHVGMDERWKDRLMLGAIVLAVAAFVAQTYSTRIQALSAPSEARRRATVSANARREDTLTLAASEDDVK